ncbi:MAG: hypothetical protein AB1671_01195 [Thermodesulfobacteriota bacterium]
MPIPLFPVLGLPSNPMLLDLTATFTPLLAGLVLLTGLCGLGIGILAARAGHTHGASPTKSRTTPPGFPKAA